MRAYVCVSWKKVAQKLLKSCSKKQKETALFLSSFILGLVQKYANGTTKVSSFMQFWGVTSVVTQLCPQMKPNYYLFYYLLICHTQ